MIRKNKVAACALALILTLTASLGMTCSTKQEEATLTRAITIMQGVPNLIATFGLAPEMVKKFSIWFNSAILEMQAYRDDPSESDFLKAVNALDHLAQSSVFSPGKERWAMRLAGIAALARTIFAAFAPATAAEMASNSEDAKSARAELARQMKKLGEMVEGR